MRLFKVLLFVLSFCVCSFAYVDGPVPFVQSVGGDIARDGVPGYYSSPARFAKDEIAISLWNVFDGVEERAYAAHGAFGISRFRGAFYYVFCNLDSLYRLSYMEIESAWNWKHLALGAAYGFSMEWIPADIMWVRHRYKFGALWVWNAFYVGAELFGYTEENPSFKGGVHFSPEGRFATYVEFDRHNAYVGNEACFKYGVMAIVFRFPSFSMSASFSISVGGWFAGAGGTAGNMQNGGIFVGKTSVK